MKKLLYFLLAALLIGGGVGYFLWNKPHENMSKASADVSIQAAELFSAYAADENAANAKYLDKVIAVTGKVKDSSTGADGATKVNLEVGDSGTFGISCELDPLTKHARTTFSPGESVTLKGRCAGFNFDVQLSRCIEVK